MYSKYIPNVDLFISMHVIKEATQSSKIEGTRTNVDEALMDKADIPKLQKKVESEIQKLGSRVTKAKKVIDYLYHRPIIRCRKSR